MKKRYLFPVLILLSSLYAYTQYQKQPQQVYTKLDRQPVLVDSYVKLRLALRIYGRTTKRSQLARQSILTENNIDTTFYNERMTLLKENPKLWLFFQEDVLQRLEDMQIEKQKLVNSRKKARSKQ